MNTCKKCPRCGIRHKQGNGRYCEFILIPVDKEFTKEYPKSIKGETQCHTQ